MNKYAEAAKTCESHATTDAAMAAMNPSLYDILMREHANMKLAATVLRALADGAVLVPSELTSENGMKFGLIGEFREFYTVTDSDGSTHSESVPVSWSNIKAIHKRVVEIAASPKEPA